MIGPGSLVTGIKNFVSGTSNQDLYASWTGYRIPDGRPPVQIDFTYFKIKDTLGIEGEGCEGAENERFTISKGFVSPQGEVKFTIKYVKSNLPSLDFAGIVVGPNTVGGRFTGAATDSGNFEIRAKGVITYAMYRTTLANQSRTFIYPLTIGKVGSKMRGIGKDDTGFYIFRGEISKDEIKIEIDYPGKMKVAAEGKVLLDKKTLPNEQKGYSGTYKVTGLTSGSFVLDIAPPGTQVPPYGGAYQAYAPVAQTYPAQPSFPYPPGHQGHPHAYSHSPGPHPTQQAGSLPYFTPQQQYSHSPNPANNHGNQNYPSTPFD